MSNHLLKPNQIISAYAALAGRTAHFPKIFRFIPELPSPVRKHLVLFVFTASLLLSFFLSTAVLNQYRLLHQNRQKLADASIQRENVVKEIAYWEKISADYSEYPDVYLKIASLQYRLGETGKAKNYVDKALVLNPDLKQGRELGEYLNH